MASTVQSLVLKLALRVDPRTKAGDDFVASSPAGGQAAIGVTAGDRFTSQRLLDCYNEARFALFNNLRQSLPADKLTREISLGLVRINIIFTASGDLFSYTLPAGYLRFISLFGRYLNPTTVSSDFKPIYIVPATMLDALRDNSISHYVQSESNRFVAESAGTLICPRATAGSTLLQQKLMTGTSVWTSGLSVLAGTSTHFLSEVSVGASIVAGADTKVVASIASDTSLTVTGTWTGTEAVGAATSVHDYKLTYHGLSSWVLSDVTGGSTTEVFNPDYEPMLIELAEAICNEQGVAQVAALAKKLLNIQ